MRGVPRLPYSVLRRSFEAQCVMALLDHFTRNAGTEPGQNGFPRYPGHQFVSDLTVFMTGDIVRNKIINDFSLTVNDQIQLDQLKAVYDGKNVAQRNLYRDVVRACFELLEQELMTKENASSIMEIINA